MKGLFLILLSLLVCGCASASRSRRADRFPPAWVIYPDGGDDDGARMEEWIADHPMPAGAEIVIHDVSRGETSSSHIVQIRAAEPLHVHEHHDLVAIVQRGHGTLRLGPRELRLVPGSVVAIPRGVPHSFVNASDEPAAAYVLFTPPFDGQDTVPVAE